MIYRFDDIAYNITTKRVPTPDDKATYIGLEHLDSGELYVKRYGSDVDLKGDKLVMTKGDILFGKRNTYLKRVAIAPFDGLFSAHGMIFHPKEDVIDRRYFPFFINSDAFMDEAIRISVGSLSPTVNWKDLKDLEFDIPPIEEQKKLADKLWAAYDLKSKYANLIESIDEMVKSQFIEKIGDSRSNPKGWDIYTLRELVVPSCPISYGIVQPGEDIEEGGVPIVRPVDLDDTHWVTAKGLKRTTKEISDAYRRTILDGNELLLCVRGTTGLVGLATEELKGCNVTRGITPLSFNERVDRVFMLCMFLSDGIQEFISDNTIGSALRGINMAVIREMKFPVPPIDIQRSFASLYEQADKSKFELKKSIEKIDNVIKALMQ